jgi:hypothetical protein
MSTPIAAIASLDRALTATGQLLTVRRYTGTDTTSPTDAQTLGLVQGYKALDVVKGSSIQQAEQTVVMSPSGLRSAGWPEPIKNGDRVVVDGKERRVTQISTNSVEGVTVRYNLTVIG